MTETTPDRIEKTILLQAPCSRVWRALTDAGEFGAWFGVALDGRFAVGEAIRGHLTHPGLEHLAMEVMVERIEPQRLFSYRWHPYAVDPDADYSREPTTLVELRLEEAPGGTRLTVIESGFDRIPAERRDLAWRKDSEGWAIQLENVRRHVAG